MLNIVLFGPPGAGKGTQSAFLVSQFGLTHLSTGDVFRANIKEATELGKLAKSYMDKGNLVPDEVTINMLKAEVEARPEAQGFIFDGFPRTTDQAEALDSFLVSKGTQIDVMLSLEVPKEELVKRLLKRGEESGRADDKDEKIIRNRIKVYGEETAIVAAFYQKAGKLRTVNGIGSIEEITTRLSQEIASLT